MIIPFTKAWYAKRTWHFVGTVEGAVIAIHSDETRTNNSTYWNLYERGDGRRRYETISPVSTKYASILYTSQAKRLAEAAVTAWEHGGPLPTLISNHYAPKDRPKAKLLVFDGGRDD